MKLPAPTALECVDSDSPSNYSLNSRQRGCVRKELEPALKREDSWMAMSLLRSDERDEEG